MPKANVAKTASAPKLLSLIIILVGLGLLFVADNKFGLITPPAKLVIGGKTYNYDLADTAITQEQGLSGRKSLASDRALLFVFKTPSASCFWMKDMNFPLDIIWLDSDKKVIHTEASLSPNTYPKLFCPDSPAKYVIEINAGHIQPDGIELGNLAAIYRY